MRGHSPRLDRMTLRALHAAVGHEPPCLRHRPVQLGLNGDPWKVMLVSSMLNRTAIVQVRPVARLLLEAYPRPEDLAIARVRDVVDMVQPLGLHNQRGKRLVLMAGTFVGRGWTHASDLPGVGPYVMDALSIFCLGVPSWRSGDKVLGEYLLSGAGYGLHLNTGEGS